MPLIRLASDRRFIFKQKLSAEVINNSNVLQDDDDLWWPTVADKSYNFWLHLWLISPAAADLRFQIVQADSGGQFSVRAYDGTSFNNLNTNVDLATSGVLQFVAIEGILNQAIAPSIAKFRWCQLAPTVGDTIIASGSCLLVVQL